MEKGKSVQNLKKKAIFERYTWVWWGSIFFITIIIFILNMSGGGEHQLDGAQRFLLDALNAQMQRLLRENNEELYERI